MLAGNCLTALPDEMRQCTQLELLRISANNLTALPDWLFRMPRLSWLAYAGNPLEMRMRGTMDEDVAHSSGEMGRRIETIPWSDLQIGVRIGEGASGFVHKALWSSNTDSSNMRNVNSSESGSAPMEVAVKLFKGDTTSDGLPEHEMKV